MTAATLAERPDPYRAVTDRDYYDAQVERLTGRDLTDFENAVIALAPAPRPLDEHDRRILQFAARTFRTPGAREEAIRGLFGISATRYYQVLNWLIDRPEAARAYPTLVNRLRRQRADQQAARSGRRLDARSAA